MAETTENPPPQRALSALEIDLEASTAAEELRLRALEAQVEEATMGADPKARGSIELKRQAEMEFELNRRLNEMSAVQERLETSIESPLPPTSAKAGGEAFPSATGGSSASVVATPGSAVPVAAVDHHQRALEAQLAADEAKRLELEAQINSHFLTHTRSERTLLSGPVAIRAIPQSDPSVSAETTTTVLGPVEVTVTALMAAAQLDGVLVVRDRVRWRESSGIVTYGTYEGQPVAAKAFPIESVAEEETVAERFWGEVRALHSCDSRYVLNFVGFQLEPVLAVVYESFAESLALVLERSRRRVGTVLAFRHRTHILSNVAAGLAHIHTAGFVHANLKPASIMVVPLPVGGAHPLPADTLPPYKIADFGTAAPAPLSAQGPPSAAASSAVTSAAASAAGDGGTFSPWSAHGMPPRRGTPRYMCPLVVLGGAVSRASDIYSFGVLAFEVVAGQTPFAADRRNLFDPPGDMAAVTAVEQASGFDVIAASANMPLATPSGAGGGSSGFLAGFDAAAGGASGKGAVAPVEATTLRDVVMACTSIDEGPRPRGKALAMRCAMYHDALLLHLHMASVVGGANDDAVRGPGDAIDAGGVLGGSDLMVATGALAEPAVPPVGPPEPRPRDQARNGGVGGGGGSSGGGWCCFGSAPDEIEMDDVDDVPPAIAPMGAVADDGGAGGYTNELNRIDTEVAGFGGGADAGNGGVGGGGGGSGGGAGGDGGVRGSGRGSAVRLSDAVPVESASTSSGSCAGPIDATDLEMERSSSDMSSEGGAAVEVPLYLDEECVYFPAPSGNEATPVACRLSGTALSPSSLRLEWEPSAAGDGDGSGGDGVATHGGDVASGTIGGAGGDGDEFPYLRKIARAGAKWRAYVLYISPREDSTYEPLYAGYDQSFEVKGLRAKSEWWFQVEAVGAGGRGPRSVPVALTTLTRP